MSLTDFFEQIRLKVRVSDIVRQKVLLRKKNSEYHGLCPFHPEKTPSFTVNDQKHFYHCFGCGAHGDVIKFVAETHGYTYREAANIIANDNNIEIPTLTQAQKKQHALQDQLYNLLEQAVTYYQNNMEDAHFRYLSNRSISKERAAQLQIGYAPPGKGLIRFASNKNIDQKLLIDVGLIAQGENNSIYELFNDRIMFPIKNTYNKIVGFGGRKLDNSLPKYINSPETILFKKSQTMYGENIATSAAYRSNYTILVEGYMDVIALQNAGFNEAMASLGTAVTEDHLNKLWYYADEIIVCLDGDQAGLRAAKKLIDLAIKKVNQEKTISFIQLPPGCDPDDLINKEGKSAFQKLLDSRKLLSQQIWHIETSGLDSSKPEIKAALENQLLRYVNLISNPVLAKNYKYFFKELLWNLGRNPKKGRLVINANKSQLAPAYVDEADILEKSIISMLLNYPSLLGNREIVKQLSNVDFCDNELAKLRDFLIDHPVLESGDLMDKTNIEALLKTTSFYKLYGILCQQNSYFLDIKFIERNLNKIEQIFSLYCMEHFTIKLKAEYERIAKEQNEASQNRALFYIKEIQKTNLMMQQIKNSFYD